MRASAAEQHSRERGDLFTQIGAFLAEQRLSADPVHYAFAYDVLSNPSGAVAKAVARLTDGGIRLQRSDIEELGHRAVAGGQSVDQSAGPADSRHADVARAEAETQKLVADTRAQVDGFATIMRAMHDETRGFGRDLAESAQAMSRAPAIAGIDEIARITGEMLSRVHEAESRLAQATKETETLRSKLVEANDSARRDALTGLPNRRAFEEAFSARDPDAAPYCLALCDIDRFKLVNDEHGHAVGDRVLSAVGRLLGTECDGHLVVRHGGEEFAILLHGLDLMQATALLDQARATIAGKRFRNRETDKPLGAVTISVGVTAVQFSETAEDALTRADRLLYTAKAKGRDQVSAA